GFAGLWLSFRLARHWADEAWAFLAVVGLWFATTIPMYMYLSPAFAHAPSIFAVALFLWYWQRTRTRRTVVQWVGLGLLAGLMVNVYYINAALLCVPLVESLGRFRSAWRAKDRYEGGRLLLL